MHDKVQQGRKEGRTIGMKEGKNLGEERERKIRCIINIRPVLVRLLVLMPRVDP